MLTSGFTSKLSASDKMTKTSDCLKPLCLSDCNFAMFPNSSNFRECSDIMTDGNDSQNYYNNTQVVINWDYPLKLSAAAE